MQEVFEDGQKKDSKRRTLFPDLNPYGNITQPVENLHKNEETAKPKTQPIKKRFSYLKAKKRLTFTKRGLIKILAILLGVLCIVMGVYQYIAWRHSFPPPLPKDAISSLNFKVFYPTRMPKGYRYKNDSATSHNGLLFYKFINGKKLITVTEQAAPPKNIDLHKIVEGYTDLKVTIGQAAVGTSVGNPSVIIITDTTLINITSGKGVTKNEVIDVAQKIKPVVL